MKAILADINVVRQVWVLVARLSREPWHEFWEDLGVDVLTFRDLGLAPTTPDDILWRRCQSERVILVTANRNADGTDSLESVLRSENTPSSLPVFTLSDAQRLLLDRDYLDRSAEKLMEYLIDIDRVRGTGRLFLP